MAKGKIRAQEGERLDDEHVERVIAHLENGGTKKDAYEILSIKANPSRLEKIIQEYHDKKALNEKLRKSKRGTPATNQEIQTIIEGALAGTSLSEIANSIYRPTDFVKKVIDGVGIPRKGTGSWFERRFETTIPDKCVSERFKLNEIVWSDKYNGLAIVREETIKSYGYSYQIYVIEKIDDDPPWTLNGIFYTGYGGFYAQQPAENLGSLEHLKEYGLDIYKPYRMAFPKWLSNENSVSE